MRLSGDIEIERRPAVLAVPTDAVDRVGADAIARVRTLLGTEERALELGATVDGWVEVKSGLEAGERVCISPLRAPVDGMAVRIAGEPQRVAGGAESRP